MKKDKKGQIVIIGTGAGNDFENLTLKSYRRIQKAKNIYCRIDYELIIKKLKSQGKNIVSLTPFYQKFHSFQEIYENMANFLIKEAKNKGEIVYLVPGHPSVCEHPTELVIKRAKSSGINVQILPNLSFLDSIFIEGEFDPGVGMQFVAASELFKKEIYNNLSPYLTCIIACISNQLQPGRKQTVYEKFIDFINDKYNKTHPIKIIYQDLRYGSRQKMLLAKIQDIQNYKEILTTHRATCLIPCLKLKNKRNGPARKVPPRRKTPKLDKKDSHQVL